LFGFALLAAACAGAPPAAKSSAVASPPPVAHAEADSKRARASGCRASPSTVYGDEPVVFEIEGSPPGVPIDVQLVDQRGHTFAKGQLELPGQWRPLSVLSGDFTLSVGSNRVSCTVTVNRELSRASQP
jgi:hypothetical protein